MSAKHSNHNKTKKRIIILFFILLLICAIIFFITKSNKKEKKLFSKNDSSNNTSSIEIVDNIDMPDQIGTYNVLGKIVIDKIEIDKYILDETTDESLELSATKFYGPNINEVGNFCIAGHNYNEIFGFANQLEIDDTFYIIDKENSKKVTYKIYDKYTVYPDNLDCLNQDTKDKREVTLITCTPGNLTRIIIKAREV